MLIELTQQFPDAVSPHDSGGPVFRCMLRPLLHLRKSNAVLEGLPINGNRELGHWTGCSLDWSGNAKFGDCMSDSLI